LELTATDNDMTVQGHAEAFVETNGTTTVSAAKLFEIISKIPEGVMVSLETDNANGRLTVSAGKAKFALATLSADAFPDMTRVDTGVNFTLSGAELRRLLAKTAFCASTDESRAYLNGVYLHVADLGAGKYVLRAVATDGHRLAKVEMALPEGAEDMTGVILPRKLVGELRKLAEEYSQLRLRVSDRKVQIEAGDVVLTSKVMDGAFPDYARVIPLYNKAVMDVSRRMLMSAVDRVAVLSHEKSRSIRFSLKPNQLMITANNPDQENASEELKVTYDDATIEVGLNARYIADVGGQVEGDDMKFTFKDSSSPILVNDPTDSGTLYVVMPMRI
jgi:DNA polymerase-3 subunit beta